MTAEQQCVTLVDNLNGCQSTINLHGAQVVGRWKTRHKLDHGPRIWDESVKLLATDPNDIITIVDVWRDEVPTSLQAKMIQAPKIKSQGQVRRRIDWARHQLTQILRN